MKFTRKPVLGLLSIHENVENELRNYPRTAELRLRLDPDVVCFVVLRDASNARPEGCIYSPTPWDYAGNIPKG